MLFLRVSTEVSVTEVEVLPQLKLALDFLLAKKMPVVLLGDFNLPGVRWFGDNDDRPSADTVHKQDEFLSMFLSYGLRQTVNLSTRCCFGLGFL